MRFCRRLAYLALACGLQAWALGTGAQAPAVTISQPQAEQTIHDNTGAVPVAVTMRGAALGADVYLRVLLNGKPYGGDQRSPEFTLTDVERGAHALQVQLVDAKQNVLATSAPVTFHMWRASALFPSRKPAVQ